jgi:hypothetical protein
MFKYINDVMKWCMDEMCWNDLKCLNMSCGWDLNYAK